MSDTVKTAAQQITEEDLKKSLAQLEGEKQEPVKVPEPVVVVEKLEKTAAQAVAATASTDLKKALEVSEILREVTSLQGLHVDNALEVLQKSIQGAAERDFAIIRVLETMQKSLVDMSAKIEEYGKLPVPKQPTATVDQILKKSAGTDGAKPVTKKQALMVLENLAKTAQDPNDAQKYTNAVVKFDSTGQIDDAILYEVQQQLKKVAA